MSFTNQKLPKGKEYWGVKDRLKETEGDTHTQREGGVGGEQTQRRRQLEMEGKEREGKGRELYLRRRLLRSTGGP
jgi:hypothetical protein